MVECPTCHTSNPPDARICTKCSTPFGIDRAALGGEQATQAIDPADEAATVLEDPQSTQAYTDQETAALGGTGWSVPIQRMGAQDPGAPLEPGMVLGGRYEILKRLGEGGMGAVYKARDSELDRLVALKVIRPDLAGHPDILRRFKQELILARQVTHKNVVRIFDLVTADGRKFITMDFIEGRDLKSILTDRGKLPPAEAVPIMQQICRGLEAAHIESVVHRDLKPQNIMIDGAGRVYLMDFGLARSMELAGMTRTGVLMGTPDYMSPEQARAEKVDARSDLFSLGIIFYEMLTGQLPFQADTLMGKLLARTQNKAAPPAAIDRGVPQNLSDIVSKCLEADVSKRYQTVREILDDLGATTAPAGASAVEVPPVALAELGPGSQFGPRYTIESVIGEGGMGKVYKARDNELDRTVALKLVRQELAAAPTSLQRFKQELLLASRISHRNILRIHDLGDVGGVKFISMAYVQGRDLYEAIQQAGRLPVERAVNIAKQLASALQAAHAEGVVHRDLKPRNVLIDVDDHVYVSDFGLAKSLDSEASTMTRAGEVLGTPRYMSPEQAESKPADHRSDIYSLGVILYEMLTGDAPFTGETSLQVMFQHVRQQPKDPRLLVPEIPEYLAKITLRCLEKDPAARYQNAAQILHDLEAGTPPTRVVRLRVAQMEYPKWLFGTLAVVLLVGAGLAIRPVRERIFGRASPAGNAAATAAASANPQFLAVLPLQVTGDDAALKYLAEGLTDALSTKLSELRQVHLAPHAAAEQVKAGDTVNRIASQLGVKQVLQGTLQGGGDKIRVVLTLSDSSGRQLWTKEFTGLRQDLLTIEDQIYDQLADVLALKPSPEEQARSTYRPTENIEAYELYLRGRETMRGSRDAKRLQSAADLFQQAVQKDSGFALAYAGLADASMAMYTLKKDGVLPQKAQAAAQQADSLNDDLPQVHLALGNVYLATGQAAEAIIELKHALALEPNSQESYGRLATAYLAAGQKDDVVRTLEQAVDADPNYWLAYDRLGRAYLQQGQNQKALAALQRGADLNPSAAAAAALADGYRLTGDKDKAKAGYDRAIALANQALQSNPKDAATLGALALAQAKNGDTKPGLESIRRARGIDPADVQLLYSEAVIDSLAGQPAAASKVLRDALEQGYPPALASNDPDLKALAADPEFAKLLAEFTPQKR